MLLRALGAQPRRRKPAFVTHDNEASLCVENASLDRPVHLSRNSVQHWGTIKIFRANVDSLAHWQRVCGAT